MFGHKIREYAGEIIRVDAEGKHVAVPLKQCCHCGNHWESVKGSGRRVGFCTRCMGDVCGPACAVCEPFEGKILEMSQPKRFIL